MSTSQQASSSSTLPPRQDTSFNDSIPTLVHIDPHRPGQEQKNIHTRWHPDIPCVADIPLGKPFRVECIDYSGGQVCNDDCADDVLDLNHDSDHHISGPFNVPNARAGDILEIEIIDIRPFRSQPWGYSVTSPGLGSLDHPDHPTQTTKSIWDFRDEETSSRHVPRVQFVGRPHPGIMGTAPSHDLLSEWNRREKELYDVEMEKGRDCGVTLPLRKGAYVGQDLDEELQDRIYTQGARTGPARENGGNIDISSWVKGSKVYLPVFVPGAKFSVGDLHFSEGDGEPTTAIEMSGIITLQINVIPSTSPLATSPVYLSSPTEPTYPRRLVFTGLSLTPQGAQTNMGGMEAYRRACFDAIDYLVRFGWTREQAYIILSVVPVETRVVATANKPNFVVSLGIPLDAFTVDISPTGLGSAPYRIDGPAYPSKERLERVDNNAHGNGH